MAIRANLLEMNDVQNAIEQLKDELDTLSLFQNSLSINTDEVKQIAEDRRKTLQCVQDQKEYLANLERENRLQIAILLVLFLCTVLLHFGCYMYSGGDQHAAVTDTNDIEIQNDTEVYFDT